MKKYIVFWYEYEHGRRKQFIKKYYVIANNKMDAVRSAIDALELWRMGRGLEYIDLENQYISTCVIEYKEVVFNERVDY